MKAAPSAADVGRRVSIRLHDPDGGFRDLLGHLVTVDEVVKKNGERVKFDPEQIARWKVVSVAPIGTGIYLYDTQSRTKKELTISDGKTLRMYCCGPTVYRDAHVGNLRTFFLADLITRLVKISGFEMQSVQNITDVGHMAEDLQESRETEEDKVLTQARLEKRDPFSIARDYESKFHQDLERLGVTPANLYPRASESIELMHRLIRQLMELGNAYLADDGTVYFSANSYSSYGAISGNRLDSLKPGHRYEYTDDGAKKFHADWALWKAAGNRHEMVWDSPWGKGFPGWHIECSAMSLHYLHGHVDLHLGGIDLRFPHHENERAQSNAAAFGNEDMLEVTDHWVHGEHLLFEGRKMSKSAGNVVLLADVIERGFDPLALRLVFLENNYRSQMDLTWAQIAAADSTIKRWRLKYQEWSAAEENSDLASAEELEKEIFDLLKDDLDTPRAIVKLRSIERNPSISDLGKAQIFASTDRFFGLQITQAPQIAAVDSEIEELLEARRMARAERNFQRSDELREILLSKKILVKDGVDGQSWEVIP